MNDILGIGEALIEFAEIQPGVYTQSFAGDVVNTLYYASRLGSKTSFYSSFGKDIYTKDLLAFLSEAGIEHSECLLSQEKNNGLYMIRTRDNGEPEFTFFRENSSARDLMLHCDEKRLSNLIDGSNVVIFSGIVLAVVHNVDMLVSLFGKKKTGTLIYFDVNVRTALWKDTSILRDWIRRLAGVVDIISLSLSDDENIFGARSKKEIIEWYRDKGYSQIILRDSANDVILSIDGVEHSVAVEPVHTVVDATGAGDAFNAAFITSYLEGKHAADCAKAGNAAAAQVLRFNGGIVKQFDPSTVVAAQ